MGSLKRVDFAPKHYGKPPVFKPMYVKRAMGVSVHCVIVNIGPRNRDVLACPMPRGASKKYRQQTDKNGERPA